jgi:parvulin-like peptidyl-prolyl isomerase
MKKFAALILVLVASTASGVTLDRIAATVGKRVILESDVLRDLRITAFLDQKPIDESGDAKRKAAERLVDQVLILREAMENRVLLPGDDEGEKLLESAKMQYGAADEYRAALARYGIREAELREHLLAGYRTLQFTDLRFRPEVRVSEDELREFYELLIAGGRRGNEPVPSFEDSREQVEKLVSDQKVIRALDSWLASTRVQMGVGYRDKVFE